MPSRTSVCWRLVAGRHERSGRVLRARIGQVLLLVERSFEAAAYFMVWRARPNGVVVPVASGQRASVRAAMAASEQIAAEMARR